MKDNKQTILLIIVIVLAAWNIFTTNGIKTDVKAYKEKIESIQTEVDSAQVVNKEIDNKVSEVKENVVTIGNASEIINSLRGVTFDWKASKKKSYGLIAQEVEVVLPELVSETVDDSLNPNSETTKTVDYDKLVSVLIEGWKEQQSQIKDLQEEVASLKAKLGK